MLSLYDREGEFVETLFVGKRNGHIDIRRLDSGRNELGWSSNGRYYAFRYAQQLMLIDMQEEIVIQTCLPIVSKPVWSPDGGQVAVLMQARENLKVVIVDIVLWQAYDVARHSGIIGNRGRYSRPDMLGWCRMD